MIEASVMSTDPSDKQLSSWWRHAVILVMALGFSLLTVVTVLTYTNAPPIPERVTDAAGATLFTRENVEHGQEVFLKHGLMEHGTLWGHGAYLGPDYSAEYLHRLAEIARDALARERHGRPYAEIDPDAASGVDAAVHRLLKENRYDPGTGALRFSAAEAAAWQTQKAEWAEYFSGKTPAPGLPAKYIRDRGELEDLTSYFAWAAWATVANRPGKDYSYTNNWPYEPAVGNRPSASTYLWSALSLGGEWLGLNDRLGTLWFWLGHQGSEYLDLGRFWQLLLAAGLAGWLVLMYRALRPAIRDRQRSELASLFLYAAAAIPLFYLPALFFGPRTNFAVIDNWRFWIIHLWVEGFFELFATVLVAVMFVVLGLVTTRTATRVIYLDAILYLTGGILGTGHHWYFTGQGTLNMGLAACFSALEVVPLTLLTLDAWDFIRLRERRCEDCHTTFADRHRWAIYFLMAVGFWNFVGAGIFGFLINLPIVSYFEVGTSLTNNHAHGSLFGVFGMLALAVLVFCLRSLAEDATWVRAERGIKVGFWGLNAGLALMMAIDLFPVSYTHLTLP